MMVNKLTRVKLVSVMGTGARLMKIGQVDTGNLKGGVKVDHRKRRTIGQIKVNNKDCFKHNEKTGEWVAPKLNEKEEQEQLNMQKSYEEFLKNKK